jgi:hypothetical protein
MPTIEVENDITEVESPKYETEDEIYENYKGLHIIITNMKLTEPSEPEGWIGGFVRYYSTNYKKMNKLMMEVTNIDEFEDSILIFSPNDNTGWMGL